VDESFIGKVDKLRSDISSKTFHEALVVIDDVLLKLRCPLGHLDAQLFYDAVLNKQFWDTLSKVQQAQAFPIRRPDPADRPASLRYAEVCRAIGLACVDPWRGQAGPTRPGFRQALKADGPKAMKDYGFCLEDNDARMVRDGLAKEVRPGVTVEAIMDDLSAEWDPVTLVNVSDRNPGDPDLEYPRFIDDFPPGWIKRFS